MAAQMYTVLYTHQKTKKAKVWQDGILKISGGQQAALYSDNRQRLDTVYVKTGVVNPGDEMESDRYLITVEAEGDRISSTSSSTENKDVQNFSRGPLKPIGLQPRAGLKRRFTGFKVPREIPKRPSLEVEKTAALSSHRLAHGCSSQPPHFSATSPLFAASYGNQDQTINCSSKHRLVTATDLNVQENIFSGNFSTSQVGERVKQNPRSTAQILALLNSFPIEKGPVAAQVPTGVSNLCSNELQSTTSTLNAPGGAKLCPLPSELSSVRTNPIKSRWDVYLDNPADSSLSQIDHEDFLLTFSQGKNQDNHAPVEVRGLERNEDLVENKQPFDSFISQPDLSNSPSLTPETLAATDFITDNENNDGAFSEITFNLMNSFDITELDVADSSESQLDSVNEHANLTERPNLLQTKNQEIYNDDVSLKNLMENGSLHENNSMVPEMSFMKAKSESTKQTLLERPSTTAKSGNNGNKTEVSSNPTDEKTTFFMWNIDSESVCRHSPGPYDAMQNRLPEWPVGTPCSDCDWESSQRSANKSNKVKTPTPNSCEEIHRFFLRPKLSNVAENTPAQLQDSSASLQPECIVKSIKVQSSLVKDLTEVSVSEDEVDDVASNTPKVLKPSTSSLRNGRHIVSQEIVSSKWTVYQHMSPESAQNVDKGESDFCPQSVFRSLDRTDELSNNDVTPTASPQHDSLKGRFGYHNHRDNGSGGEMITQLHTPSERFRPLVEKSRPHSPNTGGEQIMLTSELGFPCRQTVLSPSVPKREIHIPAFFKSSAHYKQVFSACLAEHLNIIMYELSQRLHNAFYKVDMSFYTSNGDETLRNYNPAPFCLHKQRAKLVMVRKEGPNKGRFFYACDASKARQCKFFKWLDELKVTHKGMDKPESRVVMVDMKSLSSYIRCQNISLYEESQLIIRKISTFPKRQYGKFTKFASVDSEFSGEVKEKLYLKLNRKDHSSAYCKDDLWIVSRTLKFDPRDTFIACSVFFGPSANNDIEILPLKGYSPSNWPINMVVHALLVCNASTELTCLRNIEEHFNPSSLPIMPHLLMMSSEYEKPTKIQRGKFNPPVVTAKVPSKCNIADHTMLFNVAREMITQFSLNEDQATAMLQIAHMMAIPDEFQGPRPAPITIIHGVFGAGKSYLLAVVVLFLVHLFETHNPPEEHNSVHWKLLISSSTNVAVDRVLLGLLNLGFDQFIRVGSIRKIAKPILPHSLHSGSENESEQLKELQALLKEDLTPGEKAYVRKSIELHKLGTIKSMLRQVRVVGATCAACPFTCLSNLKFPVVILDECSQMTEPSSLLPIARFQCEKLIMVGDPKQLSPTLQGSEAAHEYGLEQTLFNRLCLMGHEAVMLRTQYRCHPSISALANDLFYEGNLLNGISDEDRKPLLDWLPTLCFYNANGSEQVERNSSFYNVEEANFTVKLIQSLIASGIHGSMIGVITLYKSQMTKICCMLGSAAVFDPSDMKAVQVSTVDAFQGAEKEIIILSCVRTKQVGFIDSEKRMNVALTRGKRHLLIVGSLACLRKNKLWEQVIHHCEMHKDGLKHVSQWDEKLNAILTLYQQNKEEEEASSTQRKHIKTKAGKT
ncbi:5'-3' DNA helicase ZGRF1 [Dendrobates tinctorius]|uniref:5'-3' DNA helicase ZGRF1 n=1 Tax=Dendrobates tinctorius TaxID=92724 RepID=UPI003CC9301F